MVLLLYVAAIAIVVAAVAFWRFRPPRRRSRTELAAYARAELVRVAGSEDIADRLAEGERKRLPTADMLTCYENALQRLKRARGR